MSDPHILPPKPFYLLRHGESEANVRQVAAGGGLDTPLTEKGIAQAKELASLIHHLPVKPSCIYHSTMSRARDTAGHVNTVLNLAAHEIHDLREHMFGQWENVDWGTIKHYVAEGKNPPDGETYAAFAERVRMVICGILADDHPAPPLLIAHGGLFHAIGRLYNVPIAHVRNCELFFFEPHTKNTHLPWKISTFEWHENKTDPIFRPVEFEEDKLEL